MLRSKLLSRNQRLRQCEVSDAAHVTPGSKGDHVQLIQEALTRIDRAAIADAEFKAGLYGKTTAAAVLNFKTARQIVNRAYQTKPDDIVGKMTIKSLDDEMLKLEAADQSQRFFGAGLRPARGRLT